MKRHAKFGAAPSRRETQVAIAILFGRTQAETAADLGLAVKTVAFYRDRLYRKIGVHNSFQLVHVLMSRQHQLAEAAE